MSISPRERFWHALCEYRPQLRLLLVFTTMLLVLTVTSIVISNQSTDAYVISVVTVGILLSTIVPVGYCVWRCGNCTNKFDTAEP